MNASRYRHLKSALFAGAALIAAPAFAQTPPADAAATDTAADAAPEDEIIVTATSVARKALDTPLAVTSLGPADLARSGSVNQADILNQVPTIKADGGGGEVATNVFVRGLPSGGQYQFTPLMYDGLPVLSTFGLNSSAYDVYYRNDLGISRLEFVRGGVSNLFGPGSVAGLINYISKTGTDTFQGTAQAEVAERGRYRGDLAVSGPLGDNLYYALSGWYRRDDGPIRTDLDTEGYQIRGNLKYAFDGGGSVTVYGQWIDDKTQFYLPLPLDGRTRNRIAGNDGKKVYQVISDNVAGLGFNTPDGPFVTDITDGVSARGGQIALAFDKPLGDSGFGLNGRAKYSEYKHRFGLWSDGDGLVNVPETQAAFLSNGTRRANIPELVTATVANSRFTFADDGTALPAGALLFANRFTDRYRPMHDFTAELNLTWNGGSDAWTHGITLGGFYGSAWARDVNVTTTYLAEFNNRARLVNLTTNGGTTVVSRNGITNAGAGYVNNRHEAERYAAYFADQMKIGSRFNLDLGVRVEHYNGDISRERVSTTITDATTPGLTGALRDVIWGNDGYLTGKVSTTEWAFAGGALYKLTDRVSLYANASRGYFFPEVRAVGFAPLPAGTAANASLSPGTASFKGEIIKQVEGGIKVDQPWFDFTASAFYTKLTNRRQVLFLNAPGGGFTEAVNLVATRSYGIEAEMDLRVMKSLHLRGNLTIQSAEYTQFQTLVANVPTPNPAIIGKNLERQPDVLWNAGAYYDDGTVDLSFFTNYTGDNFTASTNTISLKGWNVYNLDGGVTFRMGGNKIRVGVNVFNLFDTDATTEGSPRQDVNQVVNNAYFVGRPVLPRRITGRVTFNF